MHFHVATFSALQDNIDTFSVPTTLHFYQSVISALIRKRFPLQIQHVRHNVFYFGFIQVF